MSVIDAVADITHETRGAVGTIRLAVTTLLEADDDAALRAQLLRSVDEEAVRLVADLSAVPAVVGALTDNSPMAPTDLAAALRRAGRELRAIGVDVQVTARGPLVVLGREDTLVGVLSALLRVAAARGATAVSARSVDGAAAVRFVGSDLRGPVVRHLVATINDASVETISDDGFAVPLARAGA